MAVNQKAAEDQTQSAVVQKQEEQDETSNKRNEVVVAIDQECPSRDIYLPANGAQREP